MNEREKLLESIAATTNDYRAAELAPPSPGHVGRWIAQFDEGCQLQILREMDHVLGSTYFSKERVESFLEGLVSTTKLVGSDACAFWDDVEFLSIQGGGNSQREMLALFDNILEEECGFKTGDCETGSSTFVYLDDAVFSGNRVRRDLESWISSEAPATATLHVIAIALHSGGQYYARTNIEAAAAASGKSIDVNWWRSIKLEDRLAYTNRADVLRPVSIPPNADVQTHVDGMRFAPRLRKGDSLGSKEIFKSDEGRQTLEREFLKAGVRIREMCPNLGGTQRPLGHSTLETLGFGSLIVTFRNCPNNAPLALWVGDPWYPLFPRITNSDTSMRRFMQMIAKESK